MSKTKRNVVERKSWQEFCDAGGLWFVNRLLHLLGWAIVVVLDDDGHVTDAYPAKVRYRGFSEANETEGFEKLTNHIAENIQELVEDAERDE